MSDPLNITVETQHDGSHLFKYDSSGIPFDDQGTAFALIIEAWEQAGKPHTFEWSQPQLEGSTYSLDDNE